MQIKNILYYVSSHGLGHAARAAQVIRELLRDYNVSIKTLAPEWLFRQIIGSRPEIIPYQTDVGCIQKNNMDIDMEKTLEAYQQQSGINKSLLEKELHFIKSNKIDIIISDISPYPFLISKKAGIPSVFIGNFTWHGIYRQHLKNDNHPIISELKQQYGMADHSLVLPLVMDMPELKNQKKTNLIARRGRNIRERLNNEHNIPEENKLVFYYSGSLDSNGPNPNLIKKINGYTIISYYPLRKNLANYVTLKSGSYRHHDIMASSDIALVKPGYGMISEAFVNNVPIIHPSREDFAEYFGFLKEFETSGGTFLINRKDFDNGNWQESLLSIKDIKYKKSYPATGAKECKQFIDTLLKGNNIHGY